MSTTGDIAPPAELRLAPLWSGGLDQRRAGGGRAAPLSLNRAARFRAAWHAAIFQSQLTADRAAMPNVQHDAHLRLSPRDCSGREELLQRDHGRSNGSKNSKRSRQTSQRPDNSQPEECAGGAIQHASFFVRVPDSSVPIAGYIGGLATQCRSRRNVPSHRSHLYLHVLQYKPPEWHRQ